MAPSKMKPKARDDVEGSGARCEVVAGTHAGKSGVVRDIKTSKTGHVTITVVQPNGNRIKTLAKNVAIRIRRPGRVAKADKRRFEPREVDGVLWIAACSAFRGRIPPLSTAPTGCSAGRAPGEARAPNASDGQADRDELAKGEAVARHFLGDRPGGAWPAQGYQWLTAGRLYWVMGPAEPARLVAVPGEGEPPSS